MNNEETERELHRLVGLYNLTMDGDNYRVPSEVEAVRLLNDTMALAAAELFRYAGRRDERHLDDAQDYTNAAADQISWVLNTLANFDENLADIVNRTLAAHRDSLESEDAFIEGYADHFTPLGFLMHMNRVEDCTVCDGTAYDAQPDGVRD